MKEVKYCRIVAMLCEILGLDKQSCAEVWKCHYSNKNDDCEDISQLAYGIWKWENSSSDDSFHYCHHSQKGICVLNPFVLAFVAVLFATSLW